MALKIVQPSDVYRIETLVGCIYAEPGLRKSTLAQTSDRPLTLDFDRGIHRASFRKAFVPIQSWDDVATMEKSDFDGYATAIIDTAGRSLDSLAVHLIAKDPKNANKSGGLSLQGYGALKTEFAMFLRKLRSYRLNVLLVLHSDEQKDGDSTIVRIDAQGGSKQEIYKVSDFMGRLTINHEGAITLSLSPSDVAFGKNPANLPPLQFKQIEPSSTHMAKVFNMTLEKINAMTEEQREVSAALEVWRDLVLKAADEKALTGLIAKVPDDSRVKENAKKLLMSLAKDKGFVFSKEAAAFVPKAPAAAQGAPQGAPAAQEAPTSDPADVGTVTGGGNEAEKEPEPPQTGPAEVKLKLAAVFEAKYPDDAEALLGAFRKADALMFWKGKVKNARTSVDELSDIDASMMLQQIEGGKLSI